MPGNSYCGVYGCTNNTKSTPHLRFFSVPKDDERRRQWASLIDREDIIASQVRACVCSSHFQSSMLTNKRLKCNAVPSINLPVTSVQLPVNIECTQSIEIEIEPVPVMTNNLEVKMTESNQQSAPVFIDVSAGSEQYPISVVASDTTIPTTATTTTENLAENVKTEPDCKLERASSPFGSFLDIQARRIRCTECNKYSAENEEKMLRHVRKVHRGENPFQCYMCDYSTYNKSLFEEHVRIHQGIKPFKCSHCSYRSASKKNTKKHELIHRPDNPHKCTQCGFIARHLRSLNCHINTEHSQGPWVVGGQVVTEKPQTTCNYCKKKIEDIETHEKSRKKCRVCQMVLCNKGLVKKHMQASHGEKAKLSKADFVCAICKWSSNVKPRILLHLIHHPNQPIDDAIVDVRVLKQCGIVGQGW